VQTQQFVTVRGTRLETRIVEPPGPPRHGVTVVLLHEGLGCCARWRSLPAHLAALGLRVVAYSRAGYGNSDPIPLPRPLDYLEREADEVLGQVLDALAPGPRVLFGHSDGGSIALAYAGAANDPLLRGVITLAAHVLVENETVEGVAALAEQFRSGELAERLARYHGPNLHCAFHGWADAWLDPRFGSFNLDDRLARISVPLLVLQGSEDPYGSARQLARIARLVPHATCRLIAGADHVVYVRHERLVLEQVARFVAALERYDPINSSATR